jgi:TetR/AcrR family tetracycline transcriptional repressor
MREAESAKVRDSLTTDAIVAAAVRALQKDGLAGLSMRQLAAVLDVTPAAIYHHVKGKDELLDLCAVQIVAQIPRPDPALPWPRRLRSLILEQQRVFMRYPGLARYLLIHRESSLASLQWAEAVLAVMHDAGFQAPQSLPVLMSMSFLLNPVTLLDDKVPTKAVNPMLYRKRAAAIVRKHPGMFPCISEVLPHLEGTSYDSQFELALDRVIAGIEQELTAPAAA